MRTRDRLVSYLRREGWAPPVFFLGLVALVWGLRALGQPYYGDDEVQEDLVKVAALGNARAIVVGSSHGKGVLLDDVGIKGQNLSHNGQDLFEMAYIARSSAQHSAELGTVFIALSYFSFALDNAAYEVKGTRSRIDRRIQMYSAFPRAAFVWGDGSEYLKGLFYPVITRDHFRRGWLRTWTRAARWLRGDTQRRETPRDPSGGTEEPLDADGGADEATPDTDGGVDEKTPDTGENAPDKEGEPDQAATDPDEPAPAEAQADAEPSEKRTKRRRGRKTAAWYAQQAQFRCRHYAGLMAVMRAHHADLERDTYRELLKLVHDLEDRGVSVVLFTPPYHPFYNACFDPRMQALTRRNAARLVKATHARYFDFAAIPAFSEHTSLFIDADHLRAKGKTTFSRLLGEATREPAARR